MKKNQIPASRFTDNPGFTDHFQSHYNIFLPDLPSDFTKIDIPENI